MRVFHLHIFVVLLLVGCASHRVASARLTEHEVIQIATQVAQKAGEQFDGYQAPSATFNPQGRHWSVFWEHKPPGFPGGYIFVSVDDKSGVGTLVPSY